MRAQAYHPVDILHDNMQDIPDIVERVKRELKSGNVLIIINGKAQTGKSNCGLWLAYQLTPDPIVTFKIDRFFGVAKDTSLHNKVIVYDEVQQDVRNWWDTTYRTLKQILESYGYLHHVLIVITPRKKNMYGMLDLFHFAVKMQKIWNKEHKDFTYIANFYLLDTDLKGKDIFTGFQIKPIPKLDQAIWDEYMKTKQSNYKERIEQWIEEWERSQHKPSLADDYIEHNPIKPVYSLPRREDG